MRDGAFVEEGKILAWNPQSSTTSDLFTVALNWLKEDRLHRRKAEAEGRLAKTRGARSSGGVPTDSETFYKKYVIIVFFNTAAGDLMEKLLRYDYGH